MVLDLIEPCHLVKAREHDLASSASVLHQAAKHADSRELLLGIGVDERVALVEQDQKRSSPVRVQPVPDLSWNNLGVPSWLLRRNDLRSGQLLPQMLPDRVGGANGPHLFAFYV